MTMTTTLGQLVTTLFAQYEERYRDEKLAAVATQVTVDDLIRRGCRSAPRRTTARRRRKAA